MMTYIFFRKVVARSILSFFAIASVTSGLHAQIFFNYFKHVEGGHRIYWDDAFQHGELMQIPHPLPAYNLFPIYIMGVPPAGNPAAGFLTQGNAINQAPRWDASLAWITSSTILNDDVNIAIGGSISGTTRLLVQGSSALSTGAALNVTDASTNSILFVRNDGNVGLGTTTPANRLTVNGGVSIGAGSASTAAPANGLITQGNVVLSASAPAATINNALSVVGSASVGSSYVNLSAPSNGMIIQGNVGVGKNNPSVPLDVEVTTGYAASFSGASPVMDLTATTGTLDHNIHWVEFIDKNNKIRGIVEGQSGVDFLDPTHNPDFLLSTFSVLLVAALAASVTEPGEALELGVQIAQYASIQTWKASRQGVNYNTLSGDYAEWLPKINASEDIKTGDIVGVFGGKITKKTSGSSLIMAVSTSPAVLANMPNMEDRSGYKKIAFIGQIPVRVVGKVNKGDFIVASGNEDGSGVAVSPANMTPDLYGKMVGRAWSASQFADLKYVNVAVGLSSGKIVSYANNQSKAIENLHAQLEQLKTDGSNLDALSARLDHLESRVSGNNRVISRQSSLIKQ